MKTRRIVPSVPTRTRPIVARALTRSPTLKRAAIIGDLLTMPHVSEGAAFCVPTYTQCLGSPPVAARRRSYGRPGPGHRLGRVLAIGPGRIVGVLQFGASHEYQYRLELDDVAFRAARLHDGPERTAGGIRL